MPYELPDETSRLRCGHCGNLTRFDVERSARVQEYWHMSMAGVPNIEETTNLAESIDRITCRWCGASDRIEIVPRPTGDDPVDAGPGGTP